MREFAALADPTRRRIVELLSTGERSAGELVDEFHVSAPAISQHLKSLRDAGLVRVRVDAQRRIYTIDRAGFDNIDGWLQGVRKFWSSRLDALERELRKAAADSRRASKKGEADERKAGTERTGNRITVKRGAKSDERTKKRTRR